MYFVNTFLPHYKYKNMHLYWLYTEMWNNYLAEVCIQDTCFSTKWVFTELTVSSLFTDKFENCNILLLKIIVDQCSFIQSAFVGKSRIPSSCLKAMEGRKASDQELMVQVFRNFVKTKTKTKPETITMQILIRLILLIYLLKNVFQYSFKLWLPFLFH